MYPISAGVLPRHSMQAWVVQLTAENTQQRNTQHRPQQYNAAATRWAGGSFRRAALPGTALRHDAYSGEHGPWLVTVDTVGAEGSVV